ncbi:MAG: tetratricopeptide repeat protein, partial [Proteobacteria bacterium]|nr:tetratricopeptide repeat protein [Pseudomonadota bacterium]
MPRPKKPKGPRRKSSPGGLRKLLELGLAARKAGELGKARSLFEQAATQSPKDPNALHLLGAVLTEGGDAVGALPYLKRAAGLAEHPSILINLAAAERAAGNAQAALAAMRHAAELAPTDAGVLFRLARLSFECGDSGGARSAVTAIDIRAINDAPFLADVAKMLLLVDQPTAALAAAARARAIDASAPGILDAEGLAQLELGRTEEALKILRAAAEARPNLVEPMINLGMALAVAGRFEDALPILDVAVERDGDHADARFNRGLVRLALGDDAGGWPDYAWRLGTVAFAGHRPARAPEWDGGPLAGNLVIEGEQGLGDQIMFLSCLGDAITAAGRSAKIEVSIDPRLAGLVTRSFPEISV